MIGRKHPTLLWSLSIITLLELCVMLSATRHKLVKFHRSFKVIKGMRLKTINKSPGHTWLSHSSLPQDLLETASQRDTPGLGR